MLRKLGPKGVSIGRFLGYVNIYLTHQRMFFYMLVSVNATDPLTRANLVFKNMPNILHASEFGGAGTVGKLTMSASQRWRSRLTPTRIGNIRAERSWHRSDTGRRALTLRFPRNRKLKPKKSIWKPDPGKGPWPVSAPLRFRFVGSRAVASPEGPPMRGPSACRCPLQHLQYR